MSVLGLFFAVAERQCVLFEEVFFELLEFGVDLRGGLVVVLRLADFVFEPMRGLGVGLRAEFALVLLAQATYQVVEYGVGIFVVFFVDFFVELAL